MGVGFLFGGTARQREQWLSSSKPDETRDAYIAAASSFSKELKIVTGEANGKLFDQKVFADAIKRVLHENQNAAFKLVFHKRDTEDEALRDFKVENQHFAALKDQYPKQVHIYWTPERPRQHYAVIDDKIVILEQPRHTAFESFWATIIHDSKVSALWEKRFNTYISHLAGEKAF